MCNSILRFQYIGLLSQNALESEYGAAHLLSQNVLKINLNHYGVKPDTPYLEATCLSYCRLTALLRGVICAEGWSELAPDWLQTGQIWDFKNQFPVRFGSIILNVLTNNLLSPSFNHFLSIWCQIWPPCLWGISIHQTVRIGLKMGQIGTKWDYSGNYEDHFSVYLVNVLKNYLHKS